MDTGLIRPYSVIQWRCQWSAFCGWPSHSMCSRPHFTGKPADWSRADFAENCLLRAGSKASSVSRFREKLSPANRVQGITAISWKIALLCVMSAKLAKWVVKKWGPTCDRDISDSAIYTTAIYRAYSVYGVPENVEKDYLTRIKHDNEKINELFTTFNVNSNPKKIYRLGKFEAPNEGETRTTRTPAFWGYPPPPHSNFWIL